MADPNDQMGGAGTPRGGGPAVPRVDTQNLDVALAAMARIAEQTEASTKATVELVRHLERVSRTSKDVERNIDGWGTEFATVMRNSANLEYTIKRIQKLQAQRVGGGASRSGTAEYIQQLQKEYKILLQVLNTGKGQGRYVKEVDAALRGLDTTLKRVKKSNEATWDSEAIQEVNRTLHETAQRVGDVQRAMSKVQVQKMTQGFHEMRKTMDDAFGGQFSQTLRRIPGVAKIMQATQFRRQAGAAQAGLKTLSSQQMAMRQEAWKGAAREAVKTHGPGAMQHLRTLGYTGGRPVGNKLMSAGPLKVGGRRTIGGPTAGVSQVGGATVARAGGSLEQMSVKTMVVQQMVQGKNAAKELARADAKAGRRARFNPKTGELVGQQAETPAARTRVKRESAKSVEELATRLRDNPMGGAILKGLRRKVGGGEMPSLDAVASTVSGKGGGFLSRGFNKAVTRVAEASGGRGLLGKLSTGLLSRGAGSAASGLASGATGIGSSLLSGGLQLASKAAVPLAVVGALISAHDKVKEENKKIQENLGAYGIHGTGRKGVGFANVRDSLLSTGITKAAMWGQGQAENMKLMSTLGESGLAVGGSLRRGVDLGQAFDDRNGLSGNGFYGSVMKNAMVGGRNIGMGQEQSTRLTLKLVEKFGKTMTETQNFFLQMDDMMQSSGVTASKYIEIIDTIGDQFNDMNRSLTNTVSLLNTVGKNGRLSGEAMEKMMKGLQSPNQMSMAQRMFSATGMVASGDNQRAADSLTASMDRDMQALFEALTDQGKVSGVNSPEEIASKRHDIEMQLVANLKDRPEELKALVSTLNTTMDRRNATMAQVGALKSGNPLGVASAVEMGGESGPLAMYSKQNTLKVLARLAGFKGSDTQALLANDPKAVQRLMTSGVVAKAKQDGVLQGDFDVMGAIQAQGQARRSGAISAVQFGREADNETSFLGKGGKWNEKGQTILALQRARGVKGSDKELIQAFIQEAKKGNGGDLAKQLETLDETFAQVTSVGSALERAFRTETTERARENARAKASKIMDETRPMAEAFAKAFEGLFNKVIGMMDKMMSVLNPTEWFKRKTEDEKVAEWVDPRTDATRDILEHLDRSGMTEDQKKRYDAILARLPTDNVGKGESDEARDQDRDTKTHRSRDEAMRLAKEMGDSRYANSVNARQWIRTGSADDWLYRSKFKDYGAMIQAVQDNGGNVNAIAGKLMEGVKDHGADALIGHLQGLGETSGGRVAVNGDAAQFIATSDDARRIADAIAASNPGLMQAGQRQENGTIVYNINTNYNPRTKPEDSGPPAAGAAAAKPPAPIITPRMMR